MGKCFIAAMVIFVSLSAAARTGLAEPIASKQRRAVSPGNTTYYVNPVSGDDHDSGLKETSAWRTFEPINRLQLASGDRVEIVEPGSFDQTLMLMGRATAEQPIVVRFSSGRYDLFPTHATRRKYQISNTNGAPDSDKAIGILIEQSTHVQIEGPGALLVYRGKMIEVSIDGCENITVSELQFDYHRPTVSEFTVGDVEEDQVDITIHKDSWYEIQNGRIIWKGEGWQYETGLAQELIPSSGEIWRRKDPLVGMHIEEIRPFRIRARGKHNMKAGRVYQVRTGVRDCAGAFTRRSRNITWRNVHFRFMHGMGLVNQFSENLTFDSVTIAPDAKSGRTCAAWADAIQVSGCRGKLLVTNCLFSGTQDDAINVHGTHLRVVEQISEMQVKVRFMHNLTFGFKAFNPGDEITFVNAKSLEPYSPNKVIRAELLNPKEMLLTLAEPLPEQLHEDDAVENVTWTPDVEIKRCEVRRVPTRGFLITTRRKVVVTDNVFHRTRMSAILVENDAKGWFESGPVRDMTIRKNRFILCGEPVIKINPQNSVPNIAVHRNIRIWDNTFVLRGATSVRAKSTTGLTVAGNEIYSNRTLTDRISVGTSDCAAVRVEKNRYGALTEWTSESDAGDDR